MNKEEEMYKLEISSFPKIQQLNTQLQSFKSLFQIGSEFELKSKEWIEGPIKKVLPEQVESETTNYARKLYKLEKSFQNQNQLPAKSIAFTVRKNIEDFRINMPVINTFLNPGLRQRHWNEINSIIDSKFVPNDDTNLQMILNMGLSQYVSKIEPISEAASKEMKIEKDVNKIVQEWNEMKFHIGPYRETNSFIFFSVDETLIKIDDDLNKLLVLKSSRFAKPFKQEIDSIEENLKNLQNLFDKLIQIQSDWMYLEPIFSSADIVNQMAESGRRFRILNKIWCDILLNLNSHPNCFNLLKIENIFDKVKKSNELLSEILKSLNDYLEKKRLYFPRFFFLSNDELLDILSETKDPERVQPHLFKCFEGINKVRISQAQEITEMISRENETIELSNFIHITKARGQVEKWLSELEDTMKKTVKNYIFNSIDSYSKTESRLEWISKWINQGVLFTTQFYWTKNVELCITRNNKDLVDYLKTHNAQISELVNFIRNFSAKQTETKIKNMHSTICSLIVLEVHSRDVLEELVKNKVSSIDEFLWLSQLRYYSENNELVCRMITAIRIYGYEYLGNTARLVITPLTDRCYRTLLMALDMNLGGAPEGILFYYFEQSTHY